MASLRRRSTFVALMLPVLFCWVIYAPLLTVGFFDEDSWYFLNFGKRLSEAGCGAPVLKMLAQSPEFAREHVRMKIGTMIWWAGTYRLFGKWVPGHHLAALLLLIGCAVCLFFMTKTLTGQKNTALLAAMLFALFPLQVCPVGNAHTVHYLLLTLLCMGSVLVFLKTETARKKRKIMLYGLSTGLGLAAMITAEPAWALPVLIFLTAWVRSDATLGRRFVSAAKKCIPFFVILTGVLAATLLAAEIYGQHTEMGRRFFDYIRLPLGKLFTVVPEGLATPYFQGTWRFALSAASLAILTAVSLLAMVTRRKQNRSALWFSLGWVIAASLPVLQVMNSVTRPVEGEEKYLLLPLVGFAVGVAVLLTPAGAGKIVRSAGSMLAALLVMVYGFGAMINGGYYIDQGRQYAAVAAGLSKTTQSAPKNAKMLLVYPKHRADWERLLAAFLDVTFGEKSERRWFFIADGRLLPLVDGLLPDGTVPRFALPDEPNRDIPFLDRGYLQNTDHFAKILVPFNDSVRVIAAVENGTKNLTNELWMLTFTPNPPESVMIDDLIQTGETYRFRAGNLPGAITGWVLLADGYLLDYQYGRF